MRQPIPSYYDHDVLKALYYAMSKTRTADTKAVNLQRTGLMSTYPSSRGQEAVGVAIGHAMQPSDISAYTTETKEPYYYVVSQ